MEQSVFDKIALWLQDLIYGIRTFAESFSTIEGGIDALAYGLPAVFVATFALVVILKVVKR